MRKHVIDYIRQRLKIRSLSINEKVLDIECDVFEYTLVERFDKNEEYKYVCVVHTVYALLQYLLLICEKEYEKTLFFVGMDAISISVSDNLTNVVLFNDRNFKSRKNTLWARFYRSIYWLKNINNAKFYCQDHLYFPSILIGFRSYALLEDGAQIYSRYKTGPLAYVEKKKDIIDIVVRASIYGRTLGRNAQCERILYTFQDDAQSDILIAHRNERIDLNQLWNNATNQKQIKINRIFNIQEGLLSKLKKNDILILTDSLVTKEIITEQEQIDIYRPYIEQSNGNVIIKKHPIDIVDYNKYFSNVTTCEGFVPMQLLTLNQCHFKKVITMFSTAVSLLDSGTEIVWLGNAGNKKIKEQYGDCPNPFLNVNR